MSAAVVWLSILVVAYAYFGYPLVIWCCARCFGKPHQPPTVDETLLPRVSVLVAAYNEEEVIAGRIRNVLQLTYPPSKWEIVVASDGSSDRTNDIVTGFSDPRVRLLPYSQRRGKAEVLNDSVSKLNGEIVVFSDANTEFAPDALTKLVRWFRDPAVGVVCGRLCLRSPEGGRNVDTVYWRYETFLKRNESCLGALLGANGAIYAIRRNLFSRIPFRTTVEDMVIPLRAKIFTGCKLIFEPEAIAVEEIAPDIQSEFRRRCRNGAGAYQSLLMLGPLLDPRYGWTAFAFASHKICRLIAPLCLVALLPATMMLLDSPLYRVLLMLQVGFYSLAVLGVVWPFDGTLSKGVRLCTMFIGMNLALLCGLFLWLAGQQRGTWRPTRRPAPT